MENLLRGLLEMETQPAVVLVEALAFSNGGMGGGGGRMHLPVAQYYGMSICCLEVVRVCGLCRVRGKKRGGEGAKGWRFDRAGGIGGGYCGSELGARAKR